MNKEKIFELIEETTKELLNTDIIMYPAGSVRYEQANKIGKSCEYILNDDKPEFIDIQNYRESLLKLISKLMEFYKEI